MARLRFSRFVYLLLIVSLPIEEFEARYPPSNLTEILDSVNLMRKMVTVIADAWRLGWNPSRIMGLGKIEKRKQKD